MSSIIPFKAEHLVQINLSESQAHYRDVFINDADYCKMLETKCVAFTGICDEGIIGIVGMIRLNTNTVEAWALLSDLFKLPRYSLFATKAVRQGCLDQFKNPEITRIQMNVQIDFEAGHRWARALGFEIEGIMKKYGINGKDHALYARIKNEIA